MKRYNWNENKNNKLKQERNVSFENVVYAIEHGGLLDTIDNPNDKKYAHQRVFIVRISDYAYIVPFVENEAEIFFKTIIPNRNMTKQYLRKE
jgi:uncharacterized DUF497 family protein